MNLCLLLLNVELNHCTLMFSQPVFTCSKLTIETLEQVVKYVQSKEIQERHHRGVLLLVKLYI